MSGAGRSIEKNSPLAGVLELIRLDRGLRESLKSDYLRIVERAKRERELADRVKRRLAQTVRVREYRPFASPGTGGTAFTAVDMRCEVLELADMAFAAPEGPYGPEA